VAQIGSHRESFAQSTSLALEILALISLSLGVINLFPFLPLPGGHVFWARVSTCDSAGARDASGEVGATHEREHPSPLIRSPGWAQGPRAHISARTTTTIGREKSSSGGVG